MKPVLDENGRLIPREDYRLSTLNCGGEDFAVACMRSNLRYEKNQRREDVKSHHYIISFDPRDGPDNGLTVDRAQALGEQFCKEHFPGHQALVCTHPDGHNHSGNIHVHIVINSLRIEEVPFLPYMDRPADTKAGCKHRCTDAALRYFKSEVMEMCHREGLYQIDLLNGSKNRVTDREYECCNYDEGNYLLLDDGEPCVCVQSISYSLMCRWFRVAVLPLDGELAAALLYRGSRKRCAVCGAAFVPKSNRGKYCPGCAGCMKKRKAAERKRKQRQKCHALEPFKPA